jgi:hypothetical protein
MLKINLNSGAVLDAHEIEHEGYVFKLLDRNGDVMDHVGQPLVDSIEAV